MKIFEEKVMKSQMNKFWQGLADLRPFVVAFAAEPFCAGQLGALFTTGGLTGDCAGLDGVELAKNKI